MSRSDDIRVRPHETPRSVDGQSTLFPDLPYRMGPRSRAFLADRKLQDFVNTAALRKYEGRLAITGRDFGARYDEWRALAGRVKSHTLDHLDHYLETFVARARERGIRVHFAGTAEEANAIAVAIAREAGARLCIKSKSMVTEETRLLPELEALGIEVVETDLGEFIIQLDRDAPSHIVMPMIHKDRVSVAEAFRREIAAPYTEDPEELTRIARAFLRRKYEGADLGISGGNFLVAETGEVVICTNEGNGRFCTSMPRVHVAMVGIEKVVPGRRELGLMLELLARSATGQALTVYTHLMGGPRRPGEPDGPEAMHVILVDAGRSRVLASEEYREALRCIRCGACLNACPVYRKATGHAYGSVYSGPIGAVLTPLMKGAANYADLPQASSLCGSCHAACPVNIDIPDLLIRLRRDLVRGGTIRRGERWTLWAAALAMRSALLYRTGGALLRRFLRRRADADGYLRRAPAFFRGWTEGRDLPQPAGESFRSWWQRRRGRS